MNELKNGSRVDLLEREWVVECPATIGGQYWWNLDGYASNISSMNPTYFPAEQAALADLRAFLDKNQGKVIG